MTKKIFIPALAVLAMLIFIIPAFSQEDMTELEDPAFTSNQRPAAQFDHMTHWDYVDQDCGGCHHGPDDQGNREEGASDPYSDRCHDCHQVDPEPGRTGLLMAYHKQCKGCHQEQGAGPITCGECHVK